MNRLDRDRKPAWWDDTNDRAMLICRISDRKQMDGVSLDAQKHNLTEYAERAGIQATPHVFRHQCVSFLTKTSGLADAELQLITGHSQRTSLQIYQHVAVDGQLADKYQAAMKELGL